MGRFPKNMDHKKTLEKILQKLVGLDFDQLSFHNHILIDEVLSEIKKLKSQIDESELPPPIPKVAVPKSNVLQFELPKKLFKLRLMVMDEDLDILNMIEYSLRNENQIELICERSPHKALEQIAVNPPDVILMDMGMKDMTSYEFLSQVKKLDKKREIEIIVGSSSPNQHEKNSFLEMGAFDYITKPYDLTEVRFKLKLRLEKKKLCV